VVNVTSFLNMDLFGSGLSENLLHTITQVLLIPVIIILIIFFIYSIASIGILIAEYYKRRKEKIKYQDNKKLILDLKKSASNDSDSTDLLRNIKNIIKESNMLSYSKEALFTIVENHNLDFETQKSLAREIVEEEELRLFKKLEKIEIIAKIAPALGLMGTLIPLGPGLLALGSGDTQTLANSLIIAFDTTVLGLVVASLTFTISKIRKRWYLKDIDALDNIAEYMLKCFK